MRLKHKAAILAMTAAAVVVGDLAQTEPTTAAPYRSERMSGIERASRGVERWRETTTTTTTTTTTAPPVTARAVSPRSVRRNVGTAPPATAQGDVLARIARCESGGRYDAENPSSSASGKYQVLDSTWDNYGGYARSSDAPPEVQEAWAREALAASGTRPWNSSRSCWSR